MAVCASESEAEVGSVKEMSLYIYLDDSTSVKALLTGYVSDLDCLSFLNSSEIAYEDDTNQIYALTYSLVSEEADRLTLNFSSTESYGAYHVTFCLPLDISLINVRVSDGLKYDSYLSEDSCVVDVQGYDVNSPAALIDYKVQS
jgi:hypothetical protein